MSADKNTLRIALIGFGEVGRRFADDLQGNPALALSTYDILREDAGKRADYERAASERKVSARENAKAACEGAHLVFSAVTAAATEKVAAEAAGFLRAARFSSTSIRQPLAPSSAQARILLHPARTTSRAR